MIALSLRTRCVGVAATLITGSALLLPAAANAAPVSPNAPVPGTSCNVGQVERATANAAPIFWEHISMHPRAKDRFEQMLVLTPAQRKAERMKWMSEHKADVQQWKMKHPHKHFTKQQRAQIRADIMQKINQIKATCATS
jgi:hypothetical protein